MKNWSWLSALLILVSSYSFFVGSMLVGREKRFGVFKNNSFSVTLERRIDCRRGCSEGVEKRKHGCSLDGKKVFPEFGLLDPVRCVYADNLGSLYWENNVHRIVEKFKKDLPHLFEMDLKSAIGKFSYCEIMFDYEGQIIGCMYRSKTSFYHVFPSEVKSLLSSQVFGRLVFYV